MKLFKTCLPNQLNEVQLDQLLRIPIDTLVLEKTAVYKIFIEDC